ncbi:serine hydrolase domain-containing protein [Asanoa siamensis]|uniref:Serine hydrolase n=1 Tax=Asanoa siamensis TaxID=926357 RepID=A0ABQ4CWE4_9ACTN|nr:serine hydrolase domain-containing protein [Asanoa siamensis]GIF75611.1 serine hydrolase [Asanoa siamensis]
MALLPELQPLLDEAARRHGVPGAAAAVGVGGELAEAATGVVNRDTGVETTHDSVFQIGSVTKVWTAALVMQLVGEGLVDLDAPVRRYLPEFGVLDPAASEAVTVRQLLAHTGGFDGDLFEDTGRGDDAVGRLVAFMRTNARQVAPPGALFSYCNSGYVALGALAARLRGGTWEASLRRHVIAPLGVRHMALYAEEAVLFRAAAGHIGAAGKLFARWQLPQSNAPAGSTPSAAMRELVRFGRMFLADGVAEDGTRILPAGTFAAMCEPQATLPDLGARAAYGWGLGLMLFDWDGVPVVGHDGSTPGQRTCWRMVPDRDVVVAITTNGGDAPAMIDEVLDAVLAATAGITVPARPTPPASPAPATPLTGRFASPAAVFEVRPADDGLEVTYTPVGDVKDDESRTMRYVPLDAGPVLVGVERDEGVHPLITFLQDGRYLYNTRAIPRA